MVLAYAAAVFLIIVVSAIFLGRFFAWLVEVIARHVLHVDLSLGTFGLFSVYGIKVKLKGGREITIDKISLQPKWTLPNSERLFTVYLGNVVISLNSKLVNEADSTQQPSSASSSSQLHFVSSHKKTVSTIIKKITKYVGLYLSHLDVHLSGMMSTSDASVSCKVLGGVQILGVLENDILSCSVSVNQLVTLLCVPSWEPVSVESKDTLAQLSVSMLIEMSLMPLQGFSLEDVHIHLKSLGVLLNEKFLSRKMDGQEIQPSYPDTTEGCVEADKGSQIISQPEDVMAEVFKKLSVVPQSTKLIVDSTKITLLNEEDRELTLEVNRIASFLSRDSNSSSSFVPKCSVDLEFSGVSLNGLRSCNLCTLNRLRFVTELSGTSDCVQLSSSIALESFHNSYVHDECSYWLEYFKHRRKTQGSIPSHEQVTGASSKKRAILESLPRGLDVRVTITAADCSTSLFLSAPRRKEQAVCRAVLASFTTQLDSCQGCTNIREVCVSTKLENSYLYIDILHNSPDKVARTQNSPHSLADNPGLLPSSCQHHWGRILALGSLSLKFNTHLGSDHDTLQLKTEGDASSLVFEWSHDVCQTILHVASKVKESIPQSHASTRESDSKEDFVSSSAVSLDGQFRISGINIFYLGVHDGGIDSLMCRVDDVTLEPSGVNRLDLAVGGMKICRMVGLKMEPYRCCKSFILDRSVLEIPRLTMSVAKEKATSVSMAEVLVTWDPNLHMALNDRMNELAEDGNRFKTLFKPLYPAEVQGDIVKTGTREISLRCDVAAFKLHMQTSCSTSFGVEFACGMVELGSSVVRANAEHIGLIFDGHKTVKFEDVTVTRSSEIQELASLRQSFKNLRTPSNVALVVEIVTTEIHFAYEFDFAASRDQLVNVVKMLKALHRKPSDASYMEPLPPDLWLKFENVIFQMDDDPFEVRLRDNYALMLDEYEQRREREELLEMRLNEIRKRPGNLLTVKKEEELHQSLKRKSAEIYTKRSKALYDEAPMRTALLTWTFEGLDLRILADESYHGKENALTMMRELDVDSPFPSTGLVFPTLWCRTVKGTLTSHQCCLRDYPQPIFTSEGVKMCGTLLGAEQESAERAKREAVIKIDEPWGDMVVQRSLTALKYYYDLDFDIDKLEMAWGVDIDPAIATVSLGFEYLSKPSVDPSKPLPFFDKVRLLHHGRLHMAMKEWNKYFSATRNPYETTERMEVEWRNVDLEWTNGGNMMTEQH